jgi:hypothetical protein
MHSRTKLLVFILTGAFVAMALLGHFHLADEPYRFGVAGRTGRGAESHGCPLPPLTGIF